MTRDDFWTLIDSIDRKSLDAGNEDAAIEPLQKMMGSLSEPDLEAFEEHLSQCLHVLDGQVFADESGESSDSDDAFLYARCYVVAKGRAHHEAALKNPKLMPKTLDHWCESLLYAHRAAWSDLTGKDQSEWPFEASVSYESGSNENLWPH
ncbi:DUF4240 domain-containing protein [Brevifollis gellanilyticus]|uniref:DUF4240 domain-containing protein n=1 Tax=Brevifollis gellanilyticus TaxID=748831 RepID=A0A512MHK0_9BACT|nr:DUF4240 domain-containing protein [Brevifollis gellanilyticus]GEP46217.1 hypothetical protein BGE01nite_55080 [Brevifollis gellanilyticus]